MKLAWPRLTALNFLVLAAVLASVAAVAFQGAPDPDRRWLRPEEILDFSTLYNPTARGAMA